MAKVRVKVPAEPKVIELPATQSEAQPNRLAQLLNSQSSFTSDDTPKQARTITLSYKTLLIAMAVVLILVSIVFVATRDNSPSPAEQAANQTENTEAKQLYTKLSKTVLLPTDELPTVANVTKEELAKQQTGLADLQENDKVLLFAKARKAVVYRPSLDKVVAVVTLSAPAASN